MHVYVAQTDYLAAVTAPRTVSTAYPESYTTDVSTSGEKVTTVRSPGCVACKVALRFPTDPGHRA
jgi:hypothetical protein